MLYPLLIPALTTALLLLVFLRAYTRTTGLRFNLPSLLLYLASGILLTIFMFTLVGVLKQNLPQDGLLTGRNLSPVLEEAAKLLLLIALLKLRLPSRDEVQLKRQAVIGGIVAGTGFGLGETAMIASLKSNISSVVMGSIPLHLVTSGFFGILIGLKLSRPWMIFWFLLIVAFHLLYNTIIRFSGLAAYSSFLILLLGAMLLLNRLTAPYAP